MKTKTSRQLTGYAALIREWAPRLDLIAPGDLDRLESRHIHDSLRLLPLLDELPPGPCIDVGSGAGLPGIPLAISSERHWRLLEPRQKRAGFLEEAVRRLDLDCEVIAATAEAAAQDPDLAGAHALAAGRALAAPAVAFELLLPLVAPAGTAAIFLGENSEVPEGSSLWQPGIAIVQKSSSSRGEAAEPT